MNDYPKNDEQFKDDVIIYVKEYDTGWSIACAFNTSFWLPKPSPIEPVAGMVTRRYFSITDNGPRYIRGLFLNKHKVYYLTKQESKECRKRNRL
jgi:hypothetical protein